VLNIQSVLLIVVVRVIYFNIYIYTYYFQKKALAFNKKEFFPPFKDENESAAISGVKRDINHHHGLVRFRLRR
jgi:hypothetical protein